MRGEDRVLELADTIGLSDVFLRVYDVVTDRSVSKIELAVERPSTKGAPIVLFSMLPGYDNFIHRVGALGHFVSRQGLHPLAVYDEGTLRSDLMSTRDEPTPRSSKITNNYRAKRITDVFGVESKELGDVGPRRHGDLDESEVLDISEYKEVNVSNFAAASTRKYLKRYTVNLEDDEVFEIYADFLNDAMYLTDVFEGIVETEDVQRIVVQEPHYIQGGVPASVGLNYEIPVFTVASGKQASTLLFGRASNRSLLPQFTSKRATRKVLGEELTIKEHKRIESLMNSRKKGENVRRQYTPPSSVGLDSPGEFSVGVFTNLTWDATLEESGGAYTDVYEWMEQTIDTLGDTDVKCVVKVHPAESKLGTNEGMVEWIESNYTNLPENVSVLPPDTDVNTYRMIEQIDGGIVYCTTTGLEMALEGLPVITGGYPHYRGFGITFDPDTKKEYRDMLRRIQEMEQDGESRERAWRYAHLLFIRKEMEFPLEKLERKVLIDDEFLRDDLSNIDFAVRKIIDNESVLKDAGG